MSLANSSPTSSSWNEWNGPPFCSSLLPLLTACLLFCKGTDESLADDMQRLEQQAQAAAAAPASKADITAKLKEKVLFVR